MLIHILTNVRINQCRVSYDWSKSSAANVLVVKCAANLRQLPDTTINNLKNSKEHILFYETQKRNRFRYV